MPTHSPIFSLYVALTSSWHVLPQGSLRSEDQRKELMISSFGQISPPFTSHRTTELINPSSGSHMHTGSPLLICSMYAHTSILQVQPLPHLPCFSKFATSLHSVEWFPKNGTRICQLNLFPAALASEVKSFSIITLFFFFPRKPDWKCVFHSVKYFTLTFPSNTKQIIGLYYAQKDFKVQKLCRKWRKKYIPHTTLLWITEKHCIHYKLICFKWVIIILWKKFYRRFASP